jgi:hypothetical protein
MTIPAAFAFLFPPALFLILGTILSVCWISDPVLFALGACGAGAAGAWLVVAAVIVARRMERAPAADSTASSGAARSS